MILCQSSSTECEVGKIIKPAAVHRHCPTSQHRASSYTQVSLMLSILTGKTCNKAHDSCRLRIYKALLWRSLRAAHHNPTFHISTISAQHQRQQFPLKQLTLSQIKMSIKTSTMAGTLYPQSSPSPEPNPPRPLPPSPPPTPPLP